jgi:solute:Na+ symporter, SSS family
MSGTFSTLDWIIVLSYLLLLLGIGWSFSRVKSKTVKDYFLGSNKMAPWVVAISVIATTQSAATFLGGPDQGYRGDYTYLAANIAAILGSIFVARTLIPRFYALKATTVYELLDQRYGNGAMRAAGLMYIVGRFFASGSRLYLAAIAVSMILFSNIDADNIIISSLILVILGFSVTFLGGIRSIIWTDLLQFIMYVLSAAAVLYFLLDTIPLSMPDIISALGETPEGQNKLRLLDFNADFSKPYALISIFTGMTLLYIASFGLDQDITQRLLTCKEGSDGGKALIVAAVIGIPIIWLFISVGHALYIFYDRPDLMTGGTGSSEFRGEKVTIFMYYILNELPAGLKGLVTVGVIAAAVSTINSGLNSMSSVLVQDFYRPWTQRHTSKPEMHYVRAGQIGMGLVGFILFAMSVLCYYWQRYSGLPLIDFALSLMVFAYSGLLGVYFTAIFTNRGSTASVICALIVGFLVTLLQQAYIIDILHLPKGWTTVAFSWQLCIGTAAAFLVCVAGNSHSGKKI